VEEDLEVVETEAAEEGVGLETEETETVMMTKEAIEVAEATEEVTEATEIVKEEEIVKEAEIVTIDMTETEIRISLTRIHSNRLVLDPNIPALTL
jgi:hypothetical protein